MLKAGNLASREDHRVRVVKSGRTDQIGGYHMYAIIQAMWINFYIAMQGFHSALYYRSPWDSLLVLESPCAKCKSPI